MGLLYMCSVFHVLNKWYNIKYDDGTLILNANMSMHYYHTKII
jgi:hypothetical protein